jgi:tripartite-type tricarboxylate transporter receptor subunit TctC
LEAIVDRLSEAIRRVSQQAELSAKVTDSAAAELTPTTPEQTSEMIRADIRKFSSAVKLSGVKID